MTASEKVHERFRKSGIDRFESLLELFPANRIDFFDGLSRVLDGIEKVLALADSRGIVTTQLYRDPYFSRRSRKNRASSTAVTSPPRSLAPRTVSGAKARSASLMGPNLSADQPSSAMRGSTSSHSRLT